MPANASSLVAAALVLPALGSCPAGGKCPLRVGILSTAAISESVIVDPCHRKPDRGVVAGIAAREVARARAWRTKHLRKLGSGCEVFPTYDALLRSTSVDAIYVPLPTALHCEQVLLALEAGKHVLVEKPFSANADQASRMVELARSRNLVLMEAMHWWYHPFRLSAREVVASGIIGSVRRVDVSVKIMMYDSVKRVNASRYAFGLGGGATLDIGGYALSFMSALLGDELPTVARAVPTRWPTDPRIDEEMVGNFTFEQAGVEGSFHVTFLQGPAGIPESTAVVRGSNATASFSNFMLPFLKRGSSIVVRALDGTVISRRSLKGGQSAPTNF